VRQAAVAEETVRVVARRGSTVIAQDRRGLVLAAAGVDASNVRPTRSRCCPLDPDASARGVRDRLRELTGARVAVVVSDTLGRPWRVGQVDLAIGVAGLAPVRDARGTTDSHGAVLEVTEIAVADELASAAELVKGKAEGVPVAVVRGLALPDDGRGAGPSCRPPPRTGSASGPTRRPGRRWPVAGRCASSPTGRSSARRSCGRWPPR
jgi:coenzyme F420-0:L-glutamate ligase/coenzyme F420-1:gamma-L-glutamate ligase